MSELPYVPPQPSQPQSSSNRTISILFIILALLVFCVCALPICLIVILALMGPAIGNVFSEIVNDLITPTPTPSILLNMVLLLF